MPHNGYNPVYFANIPTYFFLPFIVFVMHFMGILMKCIHFLHKCRKTRSPVVREKFILAKSQFPFSTHLACILIIKFYTGFIPFKLFQSVDSFMCTPFFPDLLQLFTADETNSYYKTNIKLCFFIFYVFSSLDVLWNNTDVGGCFFGTPGHHVDSLTWKYLR